MRFDMTWKKNDFDLQYQDKGTSEDLILKDVPGIKRIDEKVIQMLISNKITLIVKKREYNLIKAEKMMMMEN